jgi:hypothetical protein
MTQVIAIEIAEIEMPKNWHTAQECREKAESWSNEEMMKCIDTIMDVIWHKASIGGTSAVVDVKTSRPPQFYVTLQSKMETLGFKVSPPSVPNDRCYPNRPWTFKW